MADEERIGLWLIGARGSVATTVAAGLAALRGGDPPTIGLVTETLHKADFLTWDQLVIGGHEVRAGSLVESTVQLESQGVLPAGTATRCADELDSDDTRIRPGVVFNSGGAVDAMADSARGAATAREAIDLAAADLRAFASENDLARVVVVLLGSTEPPTDDAALPADWPALEATLNSPACPLRASSLYAIAAFEAGAAFVNFTPSLGAGCAAIDDLARRAGVPHAGADGKTGETLLKSVLAPMFAARNLRVDSWVGHNLLGNRDGAILADERNKQTKLETKQKLLGDLLGYRPQSHVSIEAIESLGEWKTAWDHVHFRGFLGVPMTLQFTWQGCDSALAAPLVLDLARLMDLALRRGEAGAISALAAFFKSPLGDSPKQALSDQTRALEAWLRS